MGPPLSASGREGSPERRRARSARTPGRRAFVELVLLISFLKPRSCPLFLRERPAHPWLVTQEPGGAGPRHLVSGRHGGRHTCKAHADAPPVLLQSCVLQPNLSATNGRSLSVWIQGISNRRPCITLPISESSDYRSHEQNSSAAKMNRASHAGGPSRHGIGVNTSQSSSAHATRHG